MNVGENMELVVLPGGMLGLARDEYFTTRAIAKGSIEIENIVNAPILEHLKAGDTVIDVGAFIGDTTVTFLRRYCKVFAIEPFYDAYVCLQHNCPAATSIWAAVGNGEYVMPSDVVPSNSYGCRYVVPGGHIPSTRLDDLHIKPQFIKIDCEGRELFALQGAACMIKECRPLMIVEHYPEMMHRAGYGESDLIGFLTDGLNYRLEQFGEPPRWDWLCYPN